MYVLPFSVGILFVALYTSAWIEIIQILPDRSNIKSHSTRVRGLKYLLSFDIIRNCRVALYTSAWIEIHDVPSNFRGGLRRTLHECVD